jgi:hypothetical protein
MRCTSAFPGCFKSLIVTSAAEFGKQNRLSVYLFPGPLTAPMPFV